MECGHYLSQFVRVSLAILAKSIEFELNTYLLIAIDCGPLTYPANGQVDTSSGTTFGSTASYSCSKGYTLNGVNTRICGIDGVWSNSQPSCNSTYTYIIIILILC